VGERDPQTVLDQVVGRSLGEPLRARFLPTYANLAAFPKSQRRYGQLAVAEDADAAYMWDGANWMNPFAAVGTAHNLLSATHTDTNPGAVVRGAMIVGNVTPAWTRLLVGAANTLLHSNGSDPNWTATPSLNGSLNFVSADGTAHLQVGAAARIGFRSAPSATQGHVEITGARTKFLTANADIQNSAGTRMMRFGMQAIVLVPKIAINSASTPTGRVGVDETSELAGGVIPLNAFTFASKQGGDFTAGQLISAFRVVGNHDVGNAAGDTSYSLDTWRSFEVLIEFRDTPVSGGGALLNFSDFYINHNTLGWQVTPVNTNIFDIVDAGPVASGEAFVFRQRQTTFNNAFAGPTMFGADQLPGAIVDVAGSRSPAANASARVARLAGTLVEAGSGTHALLAGLELTAPVVTGGAAAVTNTATLYVSGAPAATVTGANYAIWVDAGIVRVDESLLVGGSGSPAASAAIDIAATNAALLLSRLTTTQRDAMTAANGMLIYNTTAAKFQVREGGAWTDLGTTSVGDESITSQKLAPVVIIETATANTTLNSGSNTDITGCSISITPAIASTAIIWADADIEADTLGDIYVVFLQVDGGASEAQQIVFEAAKNGDRKLSGQVWLKNLSAGAHTIKLVGFRNSGAGSATVFSPHTRLMLLLVGDNNATLS
jgi:hypothetical protein